MIKQEKHKFWLVLVRCIHMISNVHYIHIYIYTPFIAILHPLEILLYYDIYIYIMDYNGIYHGTINVNILYITGIC